MTLSSDVAQGTLTGPGAQDTVRTAAGTEFHKVSFVNNHTGDVEIDLWVNGVAAQNRVAPAAITLGTNEMLVLSQKLGTGDVLYAEASVASVVAWTDEMDLL